MPTRSPAPAPLDEVCQLANGQEGVISRRQARSAGMSSSAVARRVTAGRWTCLHPGVYHLGAGSLSPLGRVWAALLYAQSPHRPGPTTPSETGRTPGSPDAAVAGQTALWLAGVLDECPATVDIAVPCDRRVRSQPGIRLVRRAAIPTYGSRQPPRLQLEEALLDVVHRSQSPTRVVSLILAAGQRRLTSPQRILLAATPRPHLRWRSLIHDLCGELQAGVHSPLERRYDREVERAHRLPRGRRNERESAPIRGAWYRDVRYDEHGLVVELDGRGAHPIDEAFRDRRRDNHATRRGERTLRYGWREVVGAPCEVAAEVAHVLVLAGWTGRPSPCHPGCTLAPPSQTLPPVEQPSR